ncbi:beta-1,6-N-acetylglucosaminyltransferase [Streptomyces sp. 1222.5]|uniref:beta-1,6-N-acetylglucosaminyltransferase n=1 Tax=Streptomyces sp. 1222.5 TaxID=1881026 RepID=UPI003D72ADF3
MPVFAILAHTEPELLARLIGRLSPFPVVIHIDAGAQATKFREAPGASYVQERVGVRWGGFSLVRATAALYRSALRLAGPNDHIVLLSGQCYPTRPVEEFAEYLTSAPFRQHCKAAELTESTSAADRVLKRWYFDAIPAGPGASYIPRALLRRGMSAITPRRRMSMFGDIRPVAGSQWTALTADCVADLLAMAKDRRWETLYRSTLAPDEMFFHTLLWNSDWRHELESTELRPWKDNLTSDFTNFHYVDRHLKGIRSIADLSAIENSGMFFTRKVELLRSKELLDALDAQARCNSRLPST